MTPKVDDAGLAEYYERPDIISDYVGKRFSDPVGRLLHENQVARLNAVIKEREVERALEIAPGPGRITAEVRGLREGLAVDSSPTMLSAASSRLSGSDIQWSLIRGSAFALPVRDASLPMVFSLRFLRHLRREGRSRVLAEVKRVLQPGGAFLFDAPNARVEHTYRRLVGYHKFPVYDELWTKAGVMAEMEEAGFRVASLEGNVRHFFTQTMVAKLTTGMGLRGAADTSVRALEALNVGEPFEWLVLCVPQ